jgi:hypothetical protein
MSDKNRFTPIDLDSEEELGILLATGSANGDDVVVDNEENRPENPMAETLWQSKPRIDNNMSCKPNKNCRYDPPPPPPPSAVTVSSAAGGKRKKWGMKQTIKNSKKYKKYKNRKRHQTRKTRKNVNNS